jgi:hypothetical protein
LAQRNYPDREIGFLLCFFLLSNGFCADIFNPEYERKNLLSGQVCL